MGLTGLFARSGPPRRRALTDADLAGDKVDAKQEREVLANALLDAWTRLAESFREDEQAHEGEAFRQQVGEVIDGVAALPADHAPDGPLLRRIAVALGPAIEERVDGLHDRIDDLAGTQRAQQQELATLKLSTSWLDDEMERCRTMINQALRGRETLLPTTGPNGMKPLISDLLAKLLDVQKPLPPTKAHQGRRRGTTTSEGTEGEHATKTAPTSESKRSPTATAAAGLAHILEEVLAGEASAGKLNRALGGKDLELAKRLADLAAEHRMYRDTLKKIGLL